MTAIREPGLVISSAAAGARILAVLPHETAMADPVGRLYRLTGGVTVAALG